MTSRGRIKTLKEDTCMSNVFFPSIDHSSITIKSLLRSLTLYKDKFPLEVRDPLILSCVEAIFGDKHAEEYI